jgi:putative transposase
MTAVVRILNLIDESTRDCLLIRANRRWSSAMVIGALADVMVWRECQSIFDQTMGRSSSPKTCANGSPIPEQRHCTSNPDPWENGYCESSHSKLRDEFLNS